LGIVRPPFGRGVRIVRASGSGDQRHHGVVPSRVVTWPSTDDGLIHLQHELARDAESILQTNPWASPSGPVVGGCFVAFARGEAGPGSPGDRAWAGAVAWKPVAGSGSPGRSVDRHLRGAAANGTPRRADDVLAQAVAAERVRAAYSPGLLAGREGPVLATAVLMLELLPDVLLVDATGVDHPRRAGLAIHLGAVTGVATVGVTQRPLVATGPLPESRRGAMTPVRVDDRCAGFWVCTKTGARPVLAHAAWRTSPETAAQIVLAASTNEARTPVPLQEARRVAREARALAGAG
jgi:deoxyribonuclease V